MRQFIVYRLVPREGSSKSDKLPVDTRSGKVASALDPSIWLGREEAQAIAAAWGGPYGIGLVFTENDPYWFLDIDSCVVNGQWSTTAQTMMTLFAGCYMETSVSGTGIHIIGTGKTPPHGCRNIPLGLEFYSSGRFCALTGAGAMGDASKDMSRLLPAFVEQYFPAATVAEEESESDGPVPEWNGPADDDELLRRAMQSRGLKASFGGAASFADLWLANEGPLTVSYPDAEGRGYDASMADMGLAQHLAFWTGKDHARIERLMMRSALVRDKWIDRADYYLPRTIRRAVGRQIDVLQDAATVAPAPTEGDLTTTGATLRGGNGWMDLAAQVDYFAGCIYVRSVHKVFLRDGSLLKPEQFRVQYGGYVFKMDAGNEKTTRDAWECFTQSQYYKWPSVDGTCFKPDRTPGEVVRISGQTFVNIYVPVEIPRKVGDVGPFLRHVEKLLPVQRDREIILAYMAACVQHQGVKFQWATLLQGVEGNGKTLLSRCVVEAVGRRYVHWPKASKLAKEFNAWMVGKVFFAVEDIYVPDARREVIEELKPMITGGDGLEIEAKGVDQVSFDICGNFMFNSNHRDAIKKTANDRRFCLLFSAQQGFEDLRRDGMAGDYFSNLYAWLRADGYAIVNEFLWTYPIPAELNPALECQRAPVTSSTIEAIGASAGNIEQEIEEAIAQGLPGFCGGWISSHFLHNLLDTLGLVRKVTRHKRKDLLEQMGYIYHPAFKDGRVNNQVMPDMAKPRLFIRKDALALQIESAADAAKDYERTNTGKMPGFMKVS